MSSTCWRCQSALNDGARFCSNCGVRVSATDTSAATPAAPSTDPAAPSTDAATPSTGSPSATPPTASVGAAVAPPASAFPELGEPAYDASDDPSTNEVAIVATPPARPAESAPSGAESAPSGAGAASPARAGSPTTGSEVGGASAGADAPLAAGAAEAVGTGLSAGQESVVHEDTTSPVSAITRQSESAPPIAPRLDGLVSEADLPDSAGEDATPVTAAPAAAADAAAADAAIDSPEPVAPAAGRSNGSPWYSVVLTDDEPAATPPAADPMAQPASSERSEGTDSPAPIGDLADSSTGTDSADEAGAGSAPTGTERFAPVVGDSVRPWGSAPSAPLTPAGDASLTGMAGTPELSGDAPTVEIPTADLSSADSSALDLGAGALGGAGLTGIAAPDVAGPDISGSDVAGHDISGADISAADIAAVRSSVDDAPTIEVPAIDGGSAELGSAALSSIGLPFHEGESAASSDPAGGAVLGTADTASADAGGRPSGASFAGGAALGGLAGAAAERADVFERSDRTGGQASTGDSLSALPGGAASPSFGTPPSAHDSSMGGSSGLSAGSSSAPITAPVTAASPIPPVTWSDPVPAATTAATQDTKKKRTSGGAGFGGLLILLGGAAMIVASFLPWANAMLGGEVTELKGFQNAVGDPWGGYGTASIGGLLVLLAFGYFAGKRRGRVSFFVKMLAFLASLGGVGFMVYLLVDLAAQTAKANAQIGMRLALGGAIVAFLGSLFGRTSKRKAAQAEALRTGGTVNSGGIPPQQPYHG